MMSYKYQEERERSTTRVSFPAFNFNQTKHLELPCDCGSPNCSLLTCVNPLQHMESASVLEEEQLIPEKLEIPDTQVGSDDEHESEISDEDRLTDLPTYESFKKKKHKSDVELTWNEECLCSFKDSKDRLLSKYIDHFNEQIHFTKNLQKLGVSPVLSKTVGTHYNSLGSKLACSPRRKPACHRLIDQEPFNFLKAQCNAQCINLSTRESSLPHHDYVANAHERVLYARRSCKCDPNMTLGIPSNKSRNKNNRDDNRAVQRQPKRTRNPCKMTTFYPTPHGVTSASIQVGPGTEGKKSEEVICVCSEEVGVQVSNQPNIVSRGCSALQKVNNANVGISCCILNSAPVCKEEFKRKKRLVRIRMLGHCGCTPKIIYRPSRKPTNTKVLNDKSKLMMKKYCLDNGHPSKKQQPNRCLSCCRLNRSPLGNNPHEQTTNNYDYCTVVSNSCECDLSGLTRPKEYSLKQEVNPQQSGKVSPVSKPNAKSNVQRSASMDFSELCSGSCISLDSPENISSSGNNESAEAQPQSQVDKKLLNQVKQQPVEKACCGCRIDSRKKSGSLQDDHIESYTSDMNQPIKCDCSCECDFQNEQLYSFNESIASCCQPVQKPGRDKNTCGCGPSCGEIRAHSTTAHFPCHNNFFPNKTPELWSQMCCIQNSKPKNHYPFSEKCHGPRYCMDIKHSFTSFYPHMAIQVDSMELVSRNPFKLIESENDKSKSSPFLIKPDIEPEYVNPKKSPKVISTKEEVIANINRATLEESAESSPVQEEASETEIDEKYKVPVEKQIANSVVKIGPAFKIDPDDTDPSMTRKVKNSGQIARITVFDGISNHDFTSPYASNTRRTSNSKRVSIGYEFPSLKKDTPSQNTNRSTRAGGLNRENTVIPEDMGERHSNQSSDSIEERIKNLRQNLEKGHDSSEGESNRSQQTLQSIKDRGLSITDEVELINKPSSQRGNYPTSIKQQRSSGRR